MALLAFTLFAGVAQADAESPAAAHIRAGLPAGLALAELTVPGVVGEGVSVVWLRPPRAGRTTILLEDGPRRLWARALLVPVVQVVVARRPLRAGERIGAGDLAREPRPSDGKVLELLPDGLAGARMLRDVAAGAALTGDAVELPPPIARGTEITIVARRGAARVTAPGILEKPARPGQPTVARLEQRLITGVLVDATTMEISP